MEGVGISERAYQRAVAYARDRVQGRPVGVEKGATGARIIEHPDIRRMLMTMRAYTEAMRAVAYVTSAAMDNAHRHPDADARKRHQAFVDFMIPIVKGCGTEKAQQVASLGIQVHGGMGFIEEAGAAQHFRDARITTIYEGTTGIQANDFIGRKTARDAGAVANVVAGEMEKVAKELARRPEPDLQAIGAGLAEGVAAVRAAAAWMVPAYGANPRAAHAVAVPYLELWGLVTGAWQLGRGALVAQRHLSAGTGDARFLAAKIRTARFYAEALLPQAAGLAKTVTGSGDSTVALAAEQF
jgi:acyl-CoA dehydrogenase